MKQASSRFVFRRMLARSLEGLDGLVLTGGTDVNPARYGQERAPETSDPDDDRDKLETRLAQ